MNMVEEKGKNIAGGEWDEYGGGKGEEYSWRRMGSRWLEEDGMQRVEGEWDEDG